MDFEQDYFMRIISDIIRMIKKLITGDSGAIYEVPEEQERSGCDNTYLQLIHMADCGEINEAENILYDFMEEGNQRYLLMGLSFYEHLNTFTDNFLSEHHYSRNEIHQGIASLAEDYHLKGITELMASTFPSDSLHS